MASTRVQLLTLASACITIVIWSALLLEVTAGKGKRDFTPGFLEMPDDTEFTGQKEIGFRCRFEEPVRRCIWRKNEWIVRFKDEMHVRFAFNESEGICDIFIHRPDLGKDTTKWKCTVERIGGEVVSTNEVVIYAKNVTRTSYYDNFFDYQLMYLSFDKTNPNLTTVHLEMLSSDDTRIRWYVDGKEVASTYSVQVNLRTIRSNIINSSITVDVSSMKESDLRVVSCCVEYKYKLKTYKIFTVYLAAPWFFALNRLSNETTLRDTFTITPPQPVLFVDDKEASELFLRFEVSYPTLHEVRLRCVETDAFPSSVLSWQALATDTDIASDFIEFNQSVQAFQESEVTALHAIFQNPKSHVIIACHAFNILAPKRYHRVAQVHIMLKYVAPVCDAPKTNPNSLSTQHLENKFLYLATLLIVIFTSL